MAAGLPQPVPPEGAPLSPAEVRALASCTPHWQVEGDMLTRKFVLPGFAEAIAFVNRVAEVAQAEDHHPDIDIRYNTVCLRLTTHKVGGLTRRDFEVAALIDQQV